MFFKNFFYLYFIEENEVEKNKICLLQNFCICRNLGYILEFWFKLELSVFFYYYNKEWVGGKENQRKIIYFYYEYQ